MIAKLLSESNLFLREEAKEAALVLVCLALVLRWHGFKLKTTITVTIYYSLLLLLQLLLLSFLGYTLRWFGLGVLLCEYLLHSLSLQIHLESSLVSYLLLLILDCCIMVYSLQFGHLS